MRGGASDALEEVRDDLLAGIQMARTLVAQDERLGPDGRTTLLHELDRRIVRSREQVTRTLRELRRGGNRRRVTDTADVTEALDEVTDLLSQLFGDRLPVLRLDVPDGLVVAAHPCSLRAIALRLLQHAIDAAVPGTPIQLAVDDVPDGVSLYVAHRSGSADGHGSLAVFQRQHLDVESLVSLGPEDGVAFYALQCLVETANGWIAVGRTGPMVTVRVTLPAPSDDAPVIRLDSAYSGPPVASPPG